MITLEKLLTELKADSLNEIVAGTYGRCGGRRSSRSSSSRSTKKSSKSTKKYGGSWCKPQPKCGPGTPKACQ